MEGLEVTLATAHVVESSASLPTTLIDAKEVETPVAPLSGVVVNVGAVVSLVLLVVNRIVAVFSFPEVSTSVVFQVNEVLVGSVCEMGQVRVLPVVSSVEQVPRVIA